MPIRIKRTADGKQFFFRVTARNGDILNPDEPLKNKDDVHTGIAALRKELNNPRLVIIDETENQKEKKPRKKKEKALLDTNIVIPTKDTVPDEN